MNVPPICLDAYQPGSVVLLLHTGVEPVGLFVNDTPAHIREVAQAVRLRTLQLHGEIAPAIIADLREFSVTPAFQLSEDDSVSTVARFLAECQRHGKHPSAILIDAYLPGSFGGTGRTVPWTLARAVVERSEVPVILAGGLTPKNVAEAIRAVRPWGVDVASGVEVAPGRKESFKVRKFIEEARRGSA